MIATGSAGEIRRAVAEQAAPFCARLNDGILQRSVAEDTIGVLASPVIGTGIPVSRLQRLFLLSMRDGATTTEQWVASARHAFPMPANVLMREALLLQIRLLALRALEVVA